MRKIKLKIWAIFMLILVSMQTMANDVFTSNRTDFRDESIYFMITTRFYDGDPSNNVLCWDNQEAQKSTKDPCWRGDFQGVIDKSTTSRLLVSQPSGLLLSFRTHLVMTITAIMPWISPRLTAAIRAVMVRAVT